MIDSSKWTIEASADEPVHEVAVRTIKARLAAIRFYLPLAAEKPAEDVEYVHQLRVATRRTVAAMEMYLAFFPKGPRKEICRELKQLRKAAGLARDLDVLVQRHAKQATKPRARIPQVPPTETMPRPTTALRRLRINTHQPIPGRPRAAVV